MFVIYAQCCFKSKGKSRKLNVKVKTKKLDSKVLNFKLHVPAYCNCLGDL